MIDRLSLAGVRHVALDMDGTIYRGRTLFDFTKPFLATLARLDIGYSFVTNNSSKSIDDYVALLQDMSIDAHRAQIITSTTSTIAYLRDRLPAARRLFVLGTPSMKSELASAGYEIVADAPDAVVIGFDTTLAYASLCAAAYWVREGKPYVASHPDPTCPTDLPTVLVDCGAVCECIAVATGRRPDAVVGKPEPFMLETVMRQAGVTADELLMAGDRLTTDIEMARRAGAIGVLVLTGASTEAEALTATHRPDLIVPSLLELGAILQAARR